MTDNLKAREGADPLRVLPGETLGDYTARMLAKHGQLAAALIFGGPEGIAVAYRSGGEFKHTRESVEAKDAWNMPSGPPNTKADPVEAHREILRHEEAERREYERQADAWQGRIKVIMGVAGSMAEEMATLEWDTKADPPRLTEAELDYADSMAECIHGTEGAEQDYSLCSACVGEREGLTVKVKADPPAEPAPNGNYLNDGAYVKCPACKGLKRTSIGNCQTCDGWGWSTEARDRALAAMGRRAERDKPSPLEGLTYLGMRASS